MARNTIARQSTHDTHNHGMYAGGGTESPSGFARDSLLGVADGTCTREAADAPAPDADAAVLAPLPLPLPEPPAVDKPDCER